MCAMHTDLLIHVAGLHVQDRIEQAAAERTKRELRQPKTRRTFLRWRRPAVTRPTVAPRH
jgi:hypothetical protein